MSTSNLAEYPTVLPFDSKNDSYAGNLATIQWTGEF